MNDEVSKERMQLQLEYMQAWLQHAPKPLEHGDNSYDAFISYRSSDRAWAMALYDALKLGAWEPFLDQYDLVPGTNLETSLTDNLQASASGVILWSSRTKAPNGANGNASHDHVEGQSAPIQGEPGGAEGSEPAQINVWNEGRPFSPGSCRNGGES